MLVKQNQIIKKCGPSRSTWDVIGLFANCLNMNSHIEAASPSHRVCIQSASEIRLIHFITPNTIHFRWFFRWRCKNMMQLSIYWISLRVFVCKRTTWKMLYIKARMCVTAGTWGRWRTFSVNSGRQCLYPWRTTVR